MTNSVFHIYCIYDSALEEFMTPFVAKNDKIAVRMFETAKKQENLILDDLTLFSVATLNLDKEKAISEAMGGLKQLATFVNSELVAVSEAKNE